MKLLGTNAKLSKTADGKYLVAGLALAPANLSGHEVCENRGYCVLSCSLWFAGRTVTPTYRDAAIFRTKMLFTDRKYFLRLLNADFDRLCLDAEAVGSKPLVRLNVGSDLDWLDVIESRPEITFYDYSKVKSRVIGKLPENYHITYSRDERSKANTIKAVLSRGRNVAVVFIAQYNPQRKVYGPLPKTWRRISGRRIKVVDGDTHDHRLPEYDGQGKVVGLRLKGTNAAKARAVASGFAVPV